MNILVTGDRGYIGSVLVPLLIDKGFNVIGFDAEYFGSVPRFKNFAYKKITKDIRKIEKKDLDGIDAIIHLSALSNDPMGQIDPKITLAINYKASVKLAKLAKKNGVKRFIFSSSCSIYGIAKNGIVNERSKINPLTAYAKSKILTEKALKELADSNFCVGIMRNSTVYGFSPKFRNDLVVNNLVTSALAFKEIKVLSDGTPWRPLIDVRDLSKIFIEFLNAKKEEINGRIFNIGFDKNNYRVKDVLNIIKKFLPECEVLYTGEHGADTRSYKVNFNKFHSTFPHISQEWSLEKSVKDLIVRLKKMKYNKKDFISGKYTRLIILKKLIDKHIVNKNLFKVNKNEFHTN